MPNFRVQYLRGTVWGLTPEQIRTRIIEGVNSHTGQPMMQEVLAKLTSALTAEERDMSEKKMDVGPPTYTDTEENLHRLFLDRRYTDFLPVVLPTTAKVNEMLAQTSRNPDDVLGNMNPGSVAGETWTYTVRHAAIAAVMAGSKPEYFPVILAIGSTGTSAINISDNGFASGAVINGRIRDEIGLNYDVGAIGPFAHANTTIGRAWSLLSINGGNAGKVGTTYMGTVGNPLNLINVIIAENEEQSPWEPLSVRRGFNRGDNVVTLLNGWGLLSARNWQVTDWTATPDYPGTVQSIYRLQNPGLFGTMVVLNPSVAGFIAERFKTLEEFEAFVTTPDPNAKPKFAAKPGGDAKPKVEGAAKPGGDAKPKVEGAAKPKVAPKPKVAGNATSQNFAVVVTGSSNNNYWMIGGLGPGQSVQIDPWR